MDGQQYLDQISQSNRPVKSPGKLSSILSSKFFIVGVIGIALLILIVILGAILGGGKSDAKTLSYELKLHLDATSEVIQDYQSHIKSSSLRSHSESLRQVLQSTSQSLTTYLEEKYNYKDKDVSKNLQETADLEKDSLSSDLFEAKINGILDRIYAHKMAYEISLFVAEEDKLAKASSDSALQDILATSESSLDNLYTSFDNFSEGN